MKQTYENQLLFRRFVVLTCVIAALGMLLASLISSTSRDANYLTIHKRVVEWQQIEKHGECSSGQQMCFSQIVINGGSVQV